MESFISYLHRLPVYTWLGNWTSSRLSGVFGASSFRGQWEVTGDGGFLPAVQEAALTQGALTQKLIQGIQPDFVMMSSGWQCRQTNRSQCHFKNAELRTSKV